MKRTGRVMSSSAGRISVAMEGNAGEAVAPCCTIPTVILEARNPKGLSVQPGELVEVSDGLGTMAIGTTSFLVVPAALYLAATSILHLWWIGLMGVLLGVVLAVLFFRSLNVDQFPRVVARAGLAVEESMERSLYEKDHCD